MLTVSTTARLLQKLLHNPPNPGRIARELSYLLARNEETRFNAYRSRELPLPQKLPPSRRHDLIPQGSAWTATDASQ